MKLPCPTCGHEHEDCQFVFDDMVIVTHEWDEKEKELFDKIVAKIGKDWFRRVGENEDLASTSVTRFNEYLLACTDLIIEHEKTEYDENWEW